MDERYIHRSNGSYYSTAELLSKLLGGFNDDINVLAKDSPFTYIEDIEMQDNTYNVYSVTDDETKLASKIFLTFHPLRTVFGKDKYIITVDMAHDQNQYPHKIYKHLPKIIKKKVKTIRSIPEFKGRIKTIKA